MFDAADLAAESTFWAGMLDGRVFTDDTFHSVIDADGRWAIAEPRLNQAVRARRASSDAQR